MSNDDKPVSDDRQLGSLLAILKDVEPTPELRELNRSSVAEALAVSRRRRLVGGGSWWRRSLLVPMPVAAGCCVLIVAMAAMVLGGPISTRGDRRAAVQPSTPRASGTAISSPGVDLSRSQRDYYAAETYVCGIGSLHTTVIHPVSEPSS